MKRGNKRSTGDFAVSNWTASLTGFRAVFQYASCARPPKALTRRARLLFQCRGAGRAHIPAAKPRLVGCVSAKANRPPCPRRSPPLFPRLCRIFMPFSRRLAYHITPKCKFMMIFYALRLSFAAAQPTADRRPPTVKKRFPFGKRLLALFSFISPEARSCRVRQAHESAGAARSVPPARPSSSPRGSLKAQAPSQGGRWFQRHTPQWSCFPR